MTTFDMTDDEVEELEDVAAVARRIADRVPAAQSSTAHAALIPWSLIHELRAALHEAGR